MDGKRKLQCDIIIEKHLGSFSVLQVKVELRMLITKRVASMLKHSRIFKGTQLTLCRKKDETISSVCESYYFANPDNKLRVSFVIEHLLTILDKYKTQLSLSDAGPSLISACVFGELHTFPRFKPFKLLPNTSWHWRCNENVLA